MAKSTRKTTRKKPSAPRLSKQRLEEMIEEATLDCHDESEQAMGWFTVINENLAVPFETTILESQATVERVDLNRSDQIVVICTRGRARQPLLILDLPLPASLPNGAEWIEAYREWCGEM